MRAVICERHPWWSGTSQDCPRCKEDARPWSWDQTLPHAFIQWKGTQVCTDLYCVCGEQWHLDEDFTYSVRCPHCQRTFYMEPFVKLHETTDAGAVERAVRGEIDDD